MPVVSDRRGRLARVPDTWFFDEHPRDFLEDTLYRQRILIARNRVLDTVLNLRQDAEYNDVIYLQSHDTHDLASFVDGLDSARSKRKRVMTARNNASTGQSAPGGHRIRSPQHMRRRRRSLFSLDDVPHSWLLYDQGARDLRKYEPFLDLMRWHLIHEAIAEMVRSHELWFMDGTWQVQTSTMDQHRGCGRRNHKSRIKRDDRTYHGRPSRDRKLAAA